MSSPNRKSKTVKGKSSKKVQFFEPKPQTPAMENNEKIVGLLNDLVRINNDRIVGYEKAADELKMEDADLKALFERYALESKQYLSELNTAVAGMGSTPAGGTTASGKVYRVWMDLKTTLTGKDRKAVLESCEFGEDAAQKAYDLALNSNTSLEPMLRELIVNQKAALRKSHDEVKRLRELHKTGS